MQFEKRLRPAIRDGSITCTVRIWKSLRVPVGGRYKMEDGEVEVDSIAPIGFPTLRLNSPASPASPAFSICSRPPNMAAAIRST